MKNHNESAPDIDLSQLLRALARRIWIVILAALIACTGTFIFTRFFVTPLYKASILMYVNNRSDGSGSQSSISHADLAASQKLVGTYAIILETRNTLAEVDAITGLDLSYGELCAMIETSPMDSTQTFRVDVTGPDPQVAATVANAIGQVLPEKIAAILDGSSARIVDDAVVPSAPCSPNVGRNMALGALAGALLAAAVIVIRELLDKKVHGTDYLMQTYDIPVLAVLPNLLADPVGERGSGRNRESSRGGAAHE